MGRCDYLMHQIEQPGEIPAALFTRILGIKQIGKTGLGLEELRQTCKSEPDPDVEELIKVPKKEIIITFVKKNELMTHHMEIIEKLLQVKIHSVIIILVEVTNTLSI